MRDGVGVEGCVATDEREAVGEVERAEACSWVVAGVLLGRAGIVHVKEAVEELGDGDGRVACAAEDDGALEAELEVDGRAEGKGLSVDIRMIRRGVALEAAVEEVVAYWAEEAGDEWDVHRLDTVDAEGVDVFGVVRPCHAGTVGGAEPCVVFASGELVPEKMIGEGAFDEAEGVLGCDGAGGDGCLIGVEAGGGTDLVDVGEGVGEGVVIAHGTGSVLVLGAGVEGEAAFLGQDGSAKEVIEAGLIGTTIVVDDGLAEVVAVAQGRLADVHAAVVDLVNAVDGVSGNLALGLLGGEFGEELGEHALGLLVASLKDLVLRALKHVEDAAARVGAQGEEHGVEVAHGVEAVELGVDPAIERDIRGAFVIGPGLVFVGDAIRRVGSVGGFCGEDVAGGFGLGGWNRLGLLLGELWTIQESYADRRRSERKKWQRSLGGLGLDGGNAANGQSCEKEKKSVTHAYLDRKAGSRCQCTLYRAFRCPSVSGKNGTSYFRFGRAGTCGVMAR